VRYFAPLLIRRGFGEKQDLFADTLADVQEREPDGNEFRQLEIHTRLLGKFVAQDFYFLVV
jgi:hypothetical protein